MSKALLRSTAFDAALEQAEIVKNGKKVYYPPTGINGKVISVRVSNNLTSSVFGHLGTNEKKNLAQNVASLKGSGLEAKSAHGPKPASKLRLVGKTGDLNGKSKTKKVVKISELIKNTQLYSKIYGDKEGFGNSGTGNKTECHSPIQSNYERSGPTTPDGISRSRSSTPDINYRSLSPSSTITLNLSSKNEIDPTSLRDSLKSFQILSFDSNWNPFTGSYSKNSKITLRSSPNLAQLIENLESQGIQISHSISSLGLKNSINFSSPSSPKLMSSRSGNVTPQRSKSPTLSHLESSDDLFGSSPGVGRNYSGIRTPDKCSESLYLWENIRYPKSENLSFQQVRRSPSYMKSTQSSSSKSRKIIEYLY